MVSTVGILGFGAIGAAFASRFSRRARVSVIVDGDRLDRYRREPTTVNGGPCDVTYVSPTGISTTGVPETHDDAGTSTPHQAVPRAAAPLDLVLFSVKAAQLDQAIELARPFIGQHTIVISLMNGIHSEQRIRDSIGHGRVLLSTSMAIDATRDGRHVTFSTIGYVSYGTTTDDPSPEESDAMTELSTFLASCGIPHRTPPDMRRAMWWKFMVNCGANQVSAVLGAPYGVFANPKGPAATLMADAQREVIAVAASLGIELPEDGIAQCQRDIATLDPTKYTSMAQDMLHHRSTEADIFGGEITELGRERHVPTPVNTTLWRIIKAREGMWDGNRKDDNGK